MVVGWGGGGGLGSDCGGGGVCYLCISSPK